MESRFVLLALALAGCTSRPGTPVPLRPEPAPARIQETPARGGQPVALCILRDGEVAAIEGTYRPERGDTVIGERPWREALPAASPPYAEAVDWYVRGEMVVSPGRELALERYGLTRILGPTEIKRFGEYRGLPLFVEALHEGPIADVVYLFVRPGCEFQPYQQAYTVGAVRGR
ncbi:MAG TPA: hypothetical protein VK420_16155 [Longimicrobium sp.]|nr:hypothetical protein [Longimicrobium sp.]